MTSTAMDIAQALYGTRETGYYSAPRFDLLAMLPRGSGLRLLELGSGHGATLRAAKQQRLASYTVGIDLVAPPDPEGIDRILCGDIETLTLDLPEESFDAILCADVLEHLVDPWRIVRVLARHLRSGGLFLASIPNFRNHRVLSAILFQGDFRYAEAGLLDRSHLRFFCRSNIRQLFEQAGLVIETMETNMGAYGLRHKVLDRLTLGLLHDFFVFQFRTRAKKP